MRFFKVDEHQLEVIKFALATVARGSSDHSKANTAQGLLDAWELEEQENKASMDRLLNGPDHPFHCDCGGSFTCSQRMARRGAFG